MGTSPFFELQEADSHRVFELLKDVYHEPQYPMGGTWTHRLIEQELSAGKGLGLRDESGRLLAFVLYRVQDGVWDITLLATAPHCRRQGGMTRLLEHFIQLRPQGFEIWLEVHEANVPAQNLYKKLGFRQVGQRPKYYRDGRGANLYSLR